jgi:superfamily II DNA helicase RecQ
MGSAENIHPKGADIPDIILVIQFGVPSSLEVWTQHAGRAGQSPDIHTRAILLVEESMFQLQKKKEKAENGGQRGLTLL